MQRVIMRLRKGPGLRFVGHLDLMRVLERAMRRAAFPVAYTEGFNPRTRLALASALAVGATSDWEVCQVDLAEPCSGAALPALVDSLREQLPADLEILQAELVLLEKTKQYIQAAAATYELTLRGAHAARRLTDFMENGPGIPAAQELSWRESGPDELLLEFKLPIGGGGPRLRDVLALMGAERPGLQVLRVHRRRLWCAKDPATFTGSSQK